MTTKSLNICLGNNCSFYLTPKLCDLHSWTSVSDLGL